MMKHSGLVGWVMLAAVLGILQYLTGQRGGFAGYLMILVNHSDTVSRG
jgi:hypothetical protein